MNLSLQNRSMQQDSDFPDAEWESRVECAAGHHLLEHYGLTDMVEGVLGVRVQGEPDAYLLKTYRTFFDEVTASGLVKVRFDETPDAGPGKPLNYASCAQARGVLERRPEINCVLHTHIPASTVVASLEGGLKPLIQHALIVYNQLVYIDCDIGNDEEAVEHMVGEMGERKIAMIRNHGVLVCGKNVAEVLFLTITLEYACDCYLRGVQADAGILPFGKDLAESLSSDFTTNPDNAGAFDGSLQWDGWLRKLDRLGACYRD